MYTEAEVKQFLVLFAAFAKATGFSDRAIASLLNVSAITVNRWSRMLLSPDNRVVSRRIADRARDQIQFLNELDRSQGIYRAINQEKASERLAILRRSLDSRAA